MDRTTRTGQWMKSNNILVNNDWLHACVEWIHEENQGTGLSEDELRTRVYEQWLLADLHELETSCLPPTLQAQPKYELNGAFALQIDSIVDVGTSFYSQQVKIKGKENANVHVNADDPNQKPWEPKPSRMLLFKLTDGTCNIQGMEYKTITCLNQQTKPGTKIIVHGNVLCRHGILMLCEQNIKHLGGEVDTLVESNTVTQVLQSAMEASEEHAGKNHKQKYTGSALRRNGQPKSGDQSYQSHTSRNNVSQSSKFGNKMKMEPVSQTRVGGMQVANMNQNISEMGDGFSDDDGFLEEMNIDDMLPVQTNSNIARTNSTAPARPVKTEQRPITAPSMSRNRSSVYQGDRTPSMSHSGVTNKISVNSTGAVKPGNSTGMIKPGNSTGVIKPVNSTGGVQPNEFEDFDEMDFEDDLEAEYLMMAESENKKREQPRQIGNMFGNQPLSRNAQMLNAEQSITDKSISSNKSISNVARTKTENNTISLNVNSNSRKRDDQTVSTVKTSGTTLSKFGTTVTPTSAEQPIIDANTSKQKLLITNANSSNTRKQPITNTNCSNTSNQSKTIASFFTKGPNLKTEQDTRNKIVNNDVDPEYPFTYLCKVMSIQPPEQPSYHTVKAYISTLTSKLSSAEGKWTLSCKINDGTMAVDVDLSDQVLTEMIGFSTKESVVMRQKIKTDPKMKMVLQEGIKQCQQKLIDLMCLLELEVCAKNPRPVIVAKKELNRHHIDMLYNRVMASWSD